MGVTTTKTNKPFNPRGNDQSPLAFNKAAIYSGKALSFDGVNDYVTISDNPAVDLGTGDFSIAFVMKSSAAGNARIIDKRNGTSGYTLYINTAKELILELNDTTGNAGFTTSTIYADGKLKHVVISADRNGKANFYINGALNESVDISSKSGNLDSTSNLLIGADAPAGDSLYFNGQMAGLKIFNTALTPAQVADLYNFPENIVPTGVANTALKLWLPMQEGAGTTAYDGSGNGNHGTISGATYVNGVGAPVAQTAVIDWNKGSNLLTHSEDFSTSAGWGGTGITATANYGTAPDGATTSTRIVFASGSQIWRKAVTLSQPGIWSLWIKGIAGQTVQITYGGGTDKILTLGSGWNRFNTNVNSPTLNELFINTFGGATARDIEVWGGKAEYTAISSPTPYVRTGATAQTTPVLLPQGLTAGRDITGVNLFENVRKQSALNLDGNSWAEVHDNASLDIVDEVTLELWYYHKETSNIPQLIGKRKNGDANWLRIYSASTNTVKLERNAGQGSGNFAITENAWNHITATIDSSDNMKFYIGGVQVGSASSFAPWGLNTTGVLGIGAWINNGNVTNNSQASGQIAQPRIYNRALTAEEVQRNYDAGKNIYS